MSHNILFFLDSECTSDQRTLITNMYIDRYTDEYLNNIYADKLEFDISTLNTWLLDQINNKIGDKWLLIDDKAFINYSETDDYTIIHQSCTIDESVNCLLLRSLCLQCPTKPIICVSRIWGMIGTVCLLCCQTFGCKITEVRLPDYPSSHYIGIEMSVDIIQQFLTYSA